MNTIIEHSQKIVNGIVVSGHCSPHQTPSPTTAIVVYNIFLPPCTELKTTTVIYTESLIALCDTAHV